ncbi:hypothetical protein [Ornithinibacillus contaminans]|uniref:hypothetical protein n=1 Tax=Ornithinibacillus contaminans TaxID=694055 RepID=UPI00064D92DC|nr:hypothetical protein [Ornithinibacillus contaminans]
MKLTWSIKTRKGFFFRANDFINFTKRLEENGQFIIATHSPILMAIPNAEIYVIEDEVIKPIAFYEVEYVKLTRDFLNNPERFYDF